MTNISSLAVAVMWFKMIPLKIVEYSYPHLNDCVFTCPHARNFYKIENMY